MFSTGNPTMGAHHSEPVPTGAHEFEQDWLSVEEAVAFCAELGLTRTPKTVRNWAKRSSGLAGGDVVSRKEDTPWGYRWQIERASLFRKVEEELELRSAHNSELVRTIAPELEAIIAEKPLQNLNERGAHVSEPVPTGAHEFAPVTTPTSHENRAEPGAHHSEPVQARSDMELVLDEVRARMSDKDREIAFLRDQLAEAQIEIGRRAASTDEALKTIDRVVRSFEMQAEANKALALRSGEEPEYRDTTQPIRFAPKGVEGHSKHQDIRRV